MSIYQSISLIYLIYPCLSNLSICYPSNISNLRMNRQINREKKVKERKGRERKKREREERERGKKTYNFDLLVTFIKNKLILM